MDGHRIGELNAPAASLATATRLPWRARSARAAVCGAVLALLASCGSPEAERGRRLFAGELPLSGRITGHAAALPPAASRCSNCHATAPQSAATSAAPAFGAPLTARRLLSELPRRGGPPSRFHEASLCRLLRSGVDPAHVIVPQAMPRYEIDDADCRALWRHLSNGSP